MLNEYLKIQIIPYEQLCIIYKTQQSIILKQLSLENQNTF